MGAMILIMANYLQVPSDFVGNPIYGVVSPVAGAPDTHTRLYVVISLGVSRPRLSCHTAFGDILSCNESLTLMFTPCPLSAK